MYQLTYKSWFESLHVLFINQIMYLSKKVWNPSIDNPNDTKDAGLRLFASALQKRISIQHLLASSSAYTANV